MDWLLTFLAVFNVASMYTVFSPRVKPRKAVPWGTFATALLATELAWIWLPLQALLAWLLALAGATDSNLGSLAMLVLAVSWGGLVWSIWKSTHARDTVEGALLDRIGYGYRAEIPAERSSELRREVSFDDWRDPRPTPVPGVEVLRNIPYGPHGVHQHLDIYRPQVIPEGGCPVLLQIHGGAWMIGDKKHQALPLMYHLASRGWICVAANYRLSPSVAFPTHLLDCKKALCWIRENGDEYGMDTDFIAVTGGSAGGHLTALMGLTANRPELQPDNPDTDTTLQAAVPFYGVYDFLVRYDQHPNRQVYQKFLNGKVMHETVEENPELWDLASPVVQVHRDAPPFMILHGTHDSLASVRDAQVFAQKLEEVSQQPVVYVEMPGAEHAWELIHSLRTEHTVDGVHRFLEWALARHRKGNG
ncbi:alpha/beta hydrolase [Seongchinamella unica]|uniref:Alpha/beta hydrolase n=1 Tax=Seongchinamella unica TaxID=2547392 RepID=A0A4R5LWA3_9GAMM|nr:alpha/beta hydrolase [Seongchinamella unica]TDG15749.1 alpha/beta hydrolase [Seongchinamella unica]